MIFDLYYISCTYIKPMNCMVLGNKQYNVLYVLINQGLRVHLAHFQQP